MSKQTATPQTISLTAVGDVSLGDHPVCFGHGVRSKIDHHGLDFLFSDVLADLGNSDIVFGNLETVLPNNKNSNDLFDMEMKGRSEYAAALSDVGFNIMSIANNHAMQHGDDAFHETVSNLNKYNIFPVGIDENGKSNCYQFARNGIKIAMIAYSLRPEKYSKSGALYAQPRNQNIIKQVESLYKDGYQIIVSLHWGEEYLHYPSPEQVSLAHHIADSGACLIIGHHPHVLQGIEKYNKTVIVYSLGNFIFDMWQKSTRESVIFKCNLSKNGVESYELIPVLANRHYQPIKLDSNSADKLLKKINTYSELIKEPRNPRNLKTEMEEYNQLAQKAYTRYRMQSYTYFLTHIYMYKPEVLFKSLTRFIKRRINPEHP